MKFLILCSLIAAALAAPGGLYGLSGLGGLGGYELGHGYGGISVAAPAIAAPTIVKSYAPAPVVVQQAPTIVKAVAPAATSYATFSQVHVTHPAPVIKYAAAPAVAVAQPVIKYAAAPAISYAQPIVKYASAPTIISGISGYGGHGYH